MKQASRDHAARLPVIATALAAGIALASGCGEFSDFTELRDVSYDDRHGERTTMDVFLPDQAAPDSDRPAVLLIHGGGWRSFSKDGMRGDATQLARAGYVSASINYRLVPDAVFPENIKDVMCALAFFRGQAGELGFNPDRIAVMGYSAGGHLASMLGVATGAPELQPDCAAGPASPPNAVISGAGPQDMRLMPQVDAVTEFVGGTLDEVPDNYDQASPIFHVARNTIEGEPPFLFVHGTGDIFVKLEQSQLMRDRLEETGNSATLLAIDDGGHLFNASADGGHAEGAVSTNTPEAWLAIFDFLADTVGAP